MTSPMRGFSILPARCAAVERRKRAGYEARMIFPSNPPSPLHTNEFHGCWDSPVRWDELVSVHELAVSMEWRGGEREGEISNFSDLWFQIAFLCLNVYIFLHLLLLFFSLALISEYFAPIFEFALSSWHIVVVWKFFLKISSILFLSFFLFSVVLKFTPFEILEFDSCRIETISNLNLVLSKQSFIRNHA